MSHLKTILADPADSLYASGDWYEEMSLWRQSARQLAKENEQLKVDLAEAKMKLQQDLPLAPEREPRMIYAQQPPWSSA